MFRWNAQYIVIPFFDVPPQRSVIIAVDFEVQELLRVVDIAVHRVDVDALII